MAERRPMITLTTDFGEADYFVPAMKGAIYTINPNAQIIDITHYIPPHDVYAAAFTLMCCYRDFPRMATHVVTVDPGVGSKRRAILVMTDGYNFVGPDNGVFSYIYQTEHVNRIVQFTTEHYFRTPISNTFHGRDIFGPCAAYISKGVDWKAMGQEIEDPFKFHTPSPVVISEKQIKGNVIHIDRFGNIITNITAKELPQERIRPGTKARIGQHEAQRFLTHFAEANPDELFAYFGSAGFLELAVPRQQAARIVDGRRGMEVEVLIP